MKASKALPLVHHPFRKRTIPHAVKDDPECLGIGKQVYGIVVNAAAESEKLEIVEVHFNEFCHRASCQSSYYETTPLPFPPLDVSNRRRNTKAHGGNIWIQKFDVLRLLEAQAIEFSL
jgi:hypothetical protein